MERGSVRRLLAQKSDDFAELHPAQVCAACVEGLGVNGAALTLIASIRGARSGPTLCASDPTISLIEELQFSLGEGPGLQAYSTGEPVLIEDMQQVPYTPWPMFTAAVREQAAQVGALFAFPLQVGAVRLGVLTLYRDSPGRIGADVLGESLLAAEVVALTLAGYAPGSPPVSVADRWCEETVNPRTDVYRATGVLMEQMRIGAGEAFVRLRAYAFGEGRNVGEVAGDVLSGKLRFEPEDA